MSKFKTVKRKARVGERILITNAGNTLGFYKDGDTMTVLRIGSIGVLTEELEGIKGGNFSIYHDEYEVTVEERPSHNERFVLTRLFDAEAQIDELQRKVKALESQLADKPTTVYNVNTTVTSDKVDVKKFTEAVRKRFDEYLPQKQTPNQRRADVIKQAREFVAERERNIVFTKMTFHVNAEKGVVTALAHSLHSGNLLDKAFAKCAPGDVSNADIGKAIAAGRLYGVKVPAEFVSAPKPTEVVVGMRVSPIDDGDWEPFKVARIGEASGKLYDYDGTWIHQHKAQIIDDTEAQY